MMSLEREITPAKFNKHLRNVFGISVNGAMPRLYLSKETAYFEMESIKHWLEIGGFLNDETLNDLDCRPTQLISSTGSVYELITLSIEY